MSIKITIEKTTTRQRTYVENFVTREAPTDKVKHSQYGGSEIVMEREFAARDCVKTEESRVTLLEQTIEVDSDFDLAAVIVAINKLNQ